ncbi:hypothetical protein M422DRAFT_49661 [Sphaerobolus stellatus SS14]|uniref:HMG box domain-containing protein n=1 Tax=Sphaerobolus stellatus (strain SS14) TaxID=990650 RepID=A0A0C9VCJ7_SPHS4|nr:hypothetical protein M422DRAFT_49661 [Sphaerobolus stellatus SS14]
MPPVRTYEDAHYDARYQHYPPAPISPQTPRRTRYGNPVQVARPPSAFHLYREDLVDSYKNDPEKYKLNLEDPDNLTRIAAELFKELPTTDRKNYDAMAKAELIMHRAQYPEAYDSYERSSVPNSAHTLPARGKKPMYGEPPAEEEGRSEKETVRLMAKATRQGLPPDFYLGASTPRKACLF